MFYGHRTLDDNYVFLLLNNNYKFTNDINTNRKKENKIVSECKQYLHDHNLNFKYKLYFVYNGNVIGYINKKNYLKS